MAVIQTFDTPLYAEYSLLIPSLLTCCGLNKFWGRASLREQRRHGNGVHARPPQDVSTQICQEHTPHHVPFHRLCPYMCQNNSQRLAPRSIVSRSSKRSPLSPAHS
jgi:hypothetical protein